MGIVYDPSKHYDIEVRDVEYRKDPARTLMARIYQPQAAGPFAVLLDLHGAPGTIKTARPMRRWTSGLRRAVSWLRRSTCAGLMRRHTRARWRT